MLNLVKNAINGRHFVLSLHEAILIKIWINSISIFSRGVSLGAEVLISSYLRSKCYRAMSIFIALFFALIARSLRGNRLNDAGRIYFSTSTKVNACKTEKKTSALNIGLTVEQSFGYSLTLHTFYSLPSLLSSDFLLVDLIDTCKLGSVRIRTKQNVSFSLK